MKVLITGANGFVGKNLIAHLRERKDVEVLRFCREDNIASLHSLVSEVDFVFHLAGVNRPQNVEEFKVGNADLTQALCAAVAVSGRKIPILYTSSIQAELSNAYGDSKREAEDALLNLSTTFGNSVHLFRLPNVFGKWARPNYNSAVATFCHNIANNLPVSINDANAKISLVYIDDVISSFISVMDGKQTGNPFVKIEQNYSITVGDLSAQLYAFKELSLIHISEPTRPY